MSRDVATMDHLAIEGCTLRVRVEGQDTKPTLVLSHMLGTDLTLWDALVPEFTKHFRLVRYDTRGHGGSGLGDKPVTVERLGRDVVAILDALGIERAHFCGESMGGAVGLWLLAHAPARIERAVIAGSAAKLGEAAVWNGRIAAALAHGMKQAVEPTIERWFSPGFVERAPESVEAVRMLLLATSPVGYAACCAALRDLDLREAVRGAGSPVLVLRGADDPVATAEGAGHLVDTVSDATEIELKARHCASVEAEAAFAAAVMKFLTTKTAPRRAGTKPKAAKPTAVPAKPVARRVGSRGVVAARRPVPRSAPASGKAIAKASASRKTATRAALPVSSRRPATAKATSAATPKTAPQKGASPKLAKSKAVQSKPTAAKPPGRAAKVGAGNVAAVRTVPAAKSVSARRATVKPQTPARRPRPSAAALRTAAMTKTKGALAKTASSKTSPATGKAKMIEPGAVKQASAKAVRSTAKVSGAKTGAKASPDKTPVKSKPAASRRPAPAAEPLRSSRRGAARPGRRKP